MKIILIINTLNGGGRERRLVQLLKSLCLRKDFIVELIVLSDNTEVDYPEVYKLGCKTLFLSTKGGKIDYQLMYKELCILRPDIVHCWCMNSKMLYYLVKCKINYRFVLISGYVADGNRIPILSTEFLTTHASFFLSDHIVSNSIAGLRAKKAPLNKSSVIYNGFDYARFNNVINIIDKRTELGLSTNDFVISMFARFCEAKDWRSFVGVAKMLKDETNIKFLAVGQGKNLEIIKSIANKHNLGNILFLGFRQDVEDIIRISNLTMLWSNEKVHAEGVSNSIMESMAAGVPVIASRGGGTAEIISNSINGFIVPPGDISLSVKIIKEIMSDSAMYKRISVKSKEEIKKRFLLSQMTDNYITLYKKLLKERRGF